MKSFSWHKKLPNFSAVAAFHRRARHDVLAKIQRVYALSDEDIRLAEPLVSELKKNIPSEIASDRWQERINSALGPQATEAEKQAVETAITHIMLDYAQAFHLRQSLFIQESIVINGPHPTPTDDYQNFYRARPTKANLMHLYINHITNEAQAELTVLTHGNPEAAFSLHTLLVGGVITAAIRNPGYNNKMIEIQPQPEQIFSIKDNLQNMASFWHEVSDALHESYRGSGASRPSHVDRLREENKISASDHVDTPLHFMASR